MLNDKQAFNVFIHRVMLEIVSHIFQCCRGFTGRRSTPWMRWLLLSFSIFILIIVRKVQDKGVLSKMVIIIIISIGYFQQQKYSKCRCWLPNAAGLLIFVLSWLFCTDCQQLENRGGWSGINAIAKGAKWVEAVVGFERQWPERKSKNICLCPSWSASLSSTSSSSTSSASSSAFSSFSASVLWQAAVQLVSFCHPVAKSFTLALTNPVYLSSTSTSSPSGSRISHWFSTPVFAILSALSPSHAPSAIIKSVAMQWCHDQIISC